MPYIIGMSTVVVLGVAYLALAGVVGLRIRALIRHRHNASAEPDTMHRPAEEDEQQPDTLSAKAATERQASFNIKVYNLRWVVLRDIVLTIILFLVSNS